MGAKIAALDGDGFLYRIAASMEKVKYGVQFPGLFLEYNTIKEAREAAKDVGTIWTRKEIGTLDDAIGRLRVAVNKAMMLCEARELMFVVSGPRNFRDQIGSIRKYKGNRDGTTRPALLAELREWAGNEYDGFVESSNMEADDCLSILGRDEDYKSGEVILVSNDKDLRQVPGYHVNWVTETREYISPDRAAANLWKQVLIGDTGDNIVGCWGTGPQTADKLVNEWKDMGLNDATVWGYIVQEFEKSKKIKGCPYSKLDAEDVAEEIYLLVHLLEYQEEAEDILRARLWPNRQNKNEKSEGSKTNGKESKELATSECESAQSAKEAENSRQSTPVPSATV